MSLQLTTEKNTSYWACTLVMEGIICIAILKCYRFFNGIFRNFTFAKKNTTMKLFFKGMTEQWTQGHLKLFVSFGTSLRKRTPLVFIIAEGCVGVMLYTEKSGHCPQVPSQKWDMQEQRTYSNSKDSHSSGPSKSCTVEIILFKVSSLLSDSAEEGKLTHLLEVLQTLEPPASFSSVLHHLSQKKPKPKSSHSPSSDIQQHKCTRN